MELKEINTISLAHHDTLIPFSMEQSDDGYYSLTTRQPIEIFHLNYKNSEAIEMRLLNITAEPPTIIPTQMVSIDPFKLYNTSTDREKQQLCLDVMLMPEVSQIVHTPVPVQIKWAPSNSFTKEHCYLACLTNYGGCSIKHGTATERELSTFADISRIWHNWLIKDQLPTIAQNTKFDELQSTINDIHITAIVWNNEMLMNNMLLACISASGKFVIFQVKTQIDESIKSVSIQMVTDLMVQKVNVLKWYSSKHFNDNKSIMIMADLYGNILLYEITTKMDSVESTIQKRNDLWVYNDKIRCGDIQIDYDDNLKKFIIVVCKGGHLLVFIVDRETYEIVDMKTYYVGNLFITGIVKINKWIYIVCTLGGTIKQLHISMNKSKNVVSINDEDILCNIDFNKYALYGMAISPNQALWFLALFPRQPYDHLVNRSPTVLSLCTLPLKITLQNLIENPTKSMKNMYDCAEVIRFCYIRNDEKLPDNLTLDEYMNSSLITKKAEISDSYLYQLKVWMILCNARAGQLSRKNRLTEAGVYDTQLHMAKRTILAITYYRQILSIFDKSDDNIDNMTNFQKLSAKSMVIYLRNYLKNDFLVEYSEIRLLFEELFMHLMERVQCLDGTAPEICVYCNEFIENGKLMCGDNHNMARCCISMVQVPIINERYCKQCRAIALDSIDDLKQVYLQQTELICCPFCDLELCTN